MSWLRSRIDFDDHATMVAVTIAVEHHRRGGDLDEEIAAVGANMTVPTNHAGAVGTYFVQGAGDHGRLAGRVPVVARCVTRPADDLFSGQSLLLEKRPVGQLDPVVGADHAHPVGNGVEQRLQVALVGRQRPDMAGDARRHVIEPVAQLRQLVTPGEPDPATVVAHGEAPAGMAQPGQRSQKQPFEPQPERQHRQSDHG